MQPQQQAPPAQPTMEKVDNDEVHIATVYRHPFGIMIIYVQVFFGLAAAAGLLFWLLPSAGIVDTEENPQVLTWLGVGILIIAAIMVLILLIATVIYRRNKLVITSKSITQIAQIGLFNRRVSQLAISNLEDATAIKKGIFQTFLDYGTLNVETAGEQNNFHFMYCPQPDRYAKYILDAREKFVERYEYDMTQANARRYQQQTYQQAYPPAQYPNQSYAPQQQYQAPMPQQQPYVSEQAQQPPQSNQYYPAPQPPQGEMDLPTPGTDYREQP